MGAMRKAGVWLGLIEDDEDRVLLTSLCDGIGTVGGGRDAIPGFDEVERHEGGNVRLVVHDEESFARGDCVGHAGRPLRRCWIFATIISMAMVLCPPRGTITSA